MIRVTLALYVALIEAGVSVTAYAVKHDQEYHEYFWAGQMAQALNAAQDVNGRPLWLTNRQQIASMMPSEYLAAYERKFLRLYGKKAGFTNSLLEKYILLPPPGIRGSPPDYSEIMLIAAQPLKKKNGKAERILIGKYQGRFGAGWIEEKQFQNSLREAGIHLSQLPAPPPMPSLRSLYDPTGELEARMREIREDLPLWARMQVGIGDWCERLDINRYWAPWIQLGLIALLVLSFGISLVWLWRRVLRNR